MNCQITYNAKLMENIADKFNDGYDKLDDAIDELRYFKNHFYSYYNGQAKVEIFDSITKTLREHLELLQLCYLNMNEYVTAAKDEMIAADEAISESIDGSDQKKEGEAGGKNN